MIPYDKIEKDCAYGSYNLNKHAGYTLKKGEKLKGPWYYIYQNRKILLYVDQNGPVKIQHQPPYGILSIKREIGENQSKWQVFIQSDSVNDGVPVSNFNNPKLSFKGETPIFTIDWCPETAIYHSVYKNLDVLTEIFVPQDKATVCMKTTITNIGEKTSNYVVTPALFPYGNIPIMAPWDLPEWYFTSTARKKEKSISIHGQTKDPLMNPNESRSMTFNIDYDDDGELELYASGFGGTNNFFDPDALKTPDVPLSMLMKYITETKAFGTFQQTYAARYRCTLAPGQSKTYTQVLTIQESLTYSEQEDLFEQSYFDKPSYDAHVQKTVEFFNDWFSKRTIKTENPLLDNFVNSFAPLQMYWTCSLDRGWPGRMRGARDVSQDFLGITPIAEQWSRENILYMLEHQQRDGWFPHCISAISREAAHDMRYYCDGGAFFLEYFHEYMTYTRDRSILFEKVWWLNDDEKSTVLEHVIECVNFYIDEKNIGEHDLAKVWYGDWWDVMDDIGMKGRGESVTVTAQMVLNLKNMADMINAFKDDIPEKYHGLPQKFMLARERFINGMQKHAYNNDGFFNGYMNDDGVWLGADKDHDPEGISRIYLVSNSWAVISGSGTPEMNKSTLDNIEKLNYGRIGYHTLTRGYAKPLKNAGRVGLRGPQANTYNHAQSFLVRACCTMGEAEMAYKATRHIFPFEQYYNPVERTYAPPYAIANMYSNNDASFQRVTFQFLSGTVSYTLRIFYNFFLGINYRYDGLGIRPCLPKAFGNCSVSSSYLGKKFVINYSQGENKSVKLNGKNWDKTVYDVEYRKDITLIPDKDMLEENVIDVIY